MAIATDGVNQFGRSFSLTVFGSDLQGLDLSKLRVKFDVKKSNVATPNVAEIRVYNLEEKTAIRLKADFKKVILQAGYPGNMGTIFQGNIKQVIIGRESATETFVDILAGDGDRAITYAIVNKTLAPGSTLGDQIKAAGDAMSAKGVSAGNLGTPPANKLARSKVMYGNAREVYRTAAATMDATFSVQDEMTQLVPNKGYLPGEAVVLTSKTGMIGTPQQTVDGVNVKCLLNPSIRVGGRVQIDNKSIEKMKINFLVPGSPSNNPARLTADGVYFVYTLEHSGDTRGTEWYTTMSTITISVSSNPLNSVQGGR